MFSIDPIIILAILGAAMGSFVDAFSWRLHTKRNFVSDRSECEHCHHKLSAADLIPILSWLMLSGKCRYCRTPISPRVPLIEAGLAVLFVASYAYWPLGFATWQACAVFGTWLLYMVLLAILFVYDLRWMLLPDKIVFPLIGLGFIDAVLRVSLQPQADAAAYFLYTGFGIVALAGIYGALYAFSKGKLVGFGDVKLGVFMGAVLGGPKALLVLGLANTIGFFVVAPGLLTGRLTRKSRVPFGPFLILGFMIAGLFGDVIIKWYLGLILGNSI